MKSLLFYLFPFVLLFAISINPAQSQTNGTVYGVSITESGNLNYQYDPANPSHLPTGGGNIDIKFSAHNVNYDVRISLLPKSIEWANAFAIQQSSGDFVNIGANPVSIFSGYAQGNNTDLNFITSLIMRPVGFNFLGGENIIGFRIEVIPLNRVNLGKEFDVNVNITKRCECDLLSSNTPPFKFDEIAKLISENDITHEKYSEFSIKSNVSWELYLSLNQNGSDMDIARPNIYVVKDNSPRIITEGDEVIVGSGERGVKSLSLAIRTVADFIHPPQTYTPLLNYRIQCGLD